MTYRLAGIRAKIERGTEHLETLTQEIQAFAEPKPYAVEVNMEEKTEDKIGVVRYRVLREPPLRLGILAGEAVSQFRSSLDHLALQLAQLRNPRIREANFPIYTSRSTYTTKVGAKRRSPQDHCRRLFRPEDLTRIEEAQPYRESVPADADLAILQRLSNIDKHAVIHTPLSRVEGFQFTPQEAGLWVLWENREATGILDSDTPLFIARFEVEPTKMNVKWRINAQIVFGEEAVTILTLKRLSERVVGIVDEFESAIPEFRP